MNTRGSYKLFAVATLFFFSNTNYAQNAPATNDNPQPVFVETVNEHWKPSLVPDGAYDRVPHVNKVLEWQPLREADVMWSKRVWREIDTRQKQNMAFRYPGDDYTGGGMFIEILIDAVKKGKVKAYSTFDDRFTIAQTKEQIMEMIAGSVDSVPVEDPIDGTISWQVVKNDFNPDLITKFRIKEDHMFDRNLGRMVVRIIGLAPLMDKYNDDGSFRASSPMFWLYYPELRIILVQYEVYNPENDVARMTWDEFFENRYFSSYVVKTSNPFDATFSVMGLEGTDLLYEGQRVNEQLFNKEHDMWVY